MMEHRGQAGIPQKTKAGIKNRGLQWYGPNEDLVTQRKPK